MTSNTYGSLMLEWHILKINMYIVCKMLGCCFRGGGGVVLMPSILGHNITPQRLVHGELPYHGQLKKLKYNIGWLTKLKTYDRVSKSK